MSGRGVEADQQCGVCPPPQPTQSITMKQQYPATQSALLCMLSFGDCHWRGHCHHMAAINITEQAAAAAAVAGFEVYNCHENHLLHLNLGAGVNRDAA